MNYMLRCRYGILVDHENQGLCSDIKGRAWRGRDKACNNKYKKYHPMTPLHDIDQRFAAIQMHLRFREEAVCCHKSQTR